MKQDAVYYIIQVNKTFFVLTSFPPRAVQVFNMHYTDQTCCKMTYYCVFPIVGVMKKILNERVFEMGPFK